MTSNFGLTVEQALARLMEAGRITDDRERREEYRKILNGVHSLSYHEGFKEGSEYGRHPGL